MSNDGGKEDIKTDQPDRAGMARRVRKSLFEKDLMTAGRDIFDSLPTAVFRDEQALNVACLYLGWLEMHGLTDEREVALWKINGTMAIGGQARKQGVMAHGNLYFPDDVSKEDKKWLAMMQQQQKDKNRRDDDGKHEGY